MTLTTNVYRKGDIYLCLLISGGLVVHAYLSSAGLWTAEPLFHIIGVSIGISLLVLPGYILCRLAGFERYGIATFAGLAIALSLGILAISGAVIWMISQSLSLPLYEAVIAGLLAALSVLVLWRRSPAPPKDGEVAIRWQALGLLAVPLGIAALALNIALPTSPATDYTEFFVVQGKPAVTVGIVNAERQTETYYVAAESSSGREVSAPIRLRPGERWQGPVTMPANLDGQLRLLLYRGGDNAPYRSLWLQ